MISKKIEKLIANLEAEARPIVLDEFNKAKTKVGMIYAIDEACENFVCHCFNCNTKTEINVEHANQINFCPSCKTTTVQGLNISMLNIYRREVKLRYVVETDDYLILSMWYGTYSIVDEKTSLEEPELDRFFCYEKDTTKLSHYSKEGGLTWSKQKPKYEYYRGYGYGQTIEIFIESDNNKKFEDLPFMKPNRARINSSTRDIQRYYENYRDEHPLVKASKTEITFPSGAESFTQEEIIALTPKVTSFYKTSNGKIATYVCNHCGKIHKLMDSYYGPQQCSCAPEMPSQIDMYVVKDQLFEDGSILLTFITTSVKSMDQSPVYAVNLTGLRVLAYVYATSEKIYFFNGDKTLCNLSDVSNSITTVVYRNRYWMNRAIFKSLNAEDEMLINLKNSVLGNIGYMNLIENNKDEGVIESMMKYINFLELYNKAKCMEQLAKLNMKKFLDDLCLKLSVPKLINKKETEAAKILGLTPYQLRQVRQANAGIDQIERYLKILKNDPNVLYESCRMFLDDTYNFEKYEEITRLEIPNLNSNTKRLTDYLQSLDDYQCIGVGEGMRIWIDYINMCKELKCDLKDKSLVYTNSLKLSHDRMVKKYNNLKNKTIIKSFEDAIKTYSHLSYENDDFLVRPPASQEELYEEGRKLNHCVGSYAKSVAEGRTIILFVRSKTDPDVPYVTVEINKTTIVQAKGKYNIPATRLPGIKKFLEEWTEEKKLSFKHC